MKKTRPALLVIAASVCTCLLFIGIQAIADEFSEPEGVPRLISYRGHLELDGLAISDEAISIEVTLYDAATDGIALWGPETHSVTPINGNFSIMLGSETTGGVDPTIFSGGDIYIGFAVGGTALAGRQRLGSVPFAMRSLDGVPSGTIIAFGGDTPPGGWVPCDGRAISRTTYHVLFDAVGTNWGDGSTTTLPGGPTGADYFNVPDLRGEFLRGADDGRGVDTGRTLGSAQSDATATNGLSLASAGSHQHLHGQPAVNAEIANYNQYGWANSGAGAHVTSGPGSQTHDRTPYTSSEPNHSHSLSGDGETRPRNVSVNYIIKY